MADRTWPVLYRKVTAGDTSFYIEEDGSYVIETVKVGNRYLEEMLEPSGEGSVLTADSLESATLKHAKQPISQSFSSESGFTRIPMDNGASLDVEHRSAADMVLEAWTFNCERMPPEDYYKLKRFLKKVGNHKLVKAVDPDGNEMYGKIAGQVQANWYVLGGNISFTVQQEPGVSSL